MHFSKLDEFLDNAINMTEVPGSHIVIHRKGEKIYEKKTGYSDIEKKIPIVGNETYDMYSCSKILTCITALTLLEKGVYHLDDPVSTYLPECDVTVFYAQQQLHQQGNALHSKMMNILMAALEHEGYIKIK